MVEYTFGYETTTMSAYDIDRAIEYESIRRGKAEYLFSTYESDCFSSGNAPKIISKNKPHRKTKKIYKPCTKCNGKKTVKRKTCPKCFGFGAI